MLRIIMWLVFTILAIAAIVNVIVNWKYKYMSYNLALLIMWVCILFMWIAVIINNTF